MFIDWLTIYQDFEHDLPILSDRHFLVIDSITGEDLGTRQPTFKHSGSYSTSITIRISGNRIIVSGNPSRINRLDNVFGYSTLDQCVGVYNAILAQYHLPAFTKATKRWQSSFDDDKARVLTDGAVITELHITDNLAVGEGNEDAFISAISSQPYRNSQPRLHTNGKTCDWLTKACRGSTLIYPCVYNKAYELELHHLTKVKKHFGIDSKEYNYFIDLINLCKTSGAVRFEQKLKSRFLQRNNLHFWGFEDFSSLHQLQRDFLSIKDKLKVRAMTYESITQQLIDQGICKTTHAANSTTNYAIQWMHGTRFDFSQSHLQKHRARLRKIGIDIALPCDISKFSLIRVKEAREIVVKPLDIPTWYKKPQTLLREVA